MTEPGPGVSDAFRTFFDETPDHAGAWLTAIEGLGSASALDGKTEALAYLAVLAATGRESGVPFHVEEAKSAGASREEVASAILIGRPAAGQAVISSLPVALDAYDSAE